ncbi:MAG: sulfite exporter TauE/SafE family protein [Halofilum sp. (in: g-proteobacteria)]|nr:sulfite exporter TauE/SafE family protein [Halofilum sp. (in: g-proteobacteria)]
MALDLGPPALAYVVAAVLLAGIVRGYSGFGFSALVMLSVSLVVAPARLLPVVLLLEIAASAYMIPAVVQAVDWRRLGLLLAGIAVSTPVGVHLLARLPEDAARVMVSALVLAAGGAIAAGLSVPDRGGRLLPVSTGLLAGGANGVAGVGGLVVVAMFLSTGAAVATTRATLVALLFATDVVAIGAAGWQGLVGWPTLLAFGVLVLPLFAGIAIGGRLFLGTTPDRFRRFVLGILLLLALAGIVRAAL